LQSLAQEFRLNFVQKVTVIMKTTIMICNKKFAFHYKELSRNRLITGGLCKIVTCILMMTN